MVRIPIITGIYFIDYLLGYFRKLRAIDDLHEYGFILFIIVVDRHREVIVIDKSGIHLLIEEHFSTITSRAKNFGFPGVERVTIYYFTALFCFHFYLLVSIGVSDEFINSSVVLCIIAIFCRIKWFNGRKKNIKLIFFKCNKLFQCTGVYFQS